MIRFWEKTLDRKVVGIPVLTININDGLKNLPWRETSLSHDNGNEVMSLPLECCDTEAHNVRMGSEKTHKVDVWLVVLWWDKFLCIDQFELNVFRRVSTPITWARHELTREGTEELAPGQVLESQSMLTREPRLLEKIRAENLNLFQQQMHTVISEVKYDAYSLSLSHVNIHRAGPVFRFRLVSVFCV
jgi:hypothetical protein